LTCKEQCAWWLSWIGF
jgi:hypothetical protein